MYHCVVCFFICLLRYFIFPSLLPQVLIMAQGGFELLKQVAAAHLDNAAVQEQLWWAVRNLTVNADNQVCRPDGGHVVVKWSRGSGEQICF